MKHQRQVNKILFIYNSKMKLQQLCAGFKKCPGHFQQLWCTGWIILWPQFFWDDSSYLLRGHGTVLKWESSPKEDGTKLNMKSGMENIFAFFFTYNTIKQTNDWKIKGNSNTFLLLIPKVHRRPQLVRRTKGPHCRKLRWNRWVALVPETKTDG